MKYLLGLIVIVNIGCAGQDLPLCQVAGGSSYVHSYGDSITDGAGADNFCNGYQALFTSSIGFSSDDKGLSGSQYADYQYSVIMKMYQAPDNNTNPTGAKYYSIHPQDINTVLPGYNDVTNFGGDIDHLNKFIQELTVGLTHLGQMGNKTFVGTTLYASTQMQNEQIHFHTNANVDLYVNAIKQVINLLQNQGLPIYLVDTNAVYDPNTMSTGNIHPNNAGHQVLANAFIQVYEANK